MRSVRHTPRDHAYHLISRFVERKWFVANHEQRQVYLDLLGYALSTSDWRCLSYAIMSSHIHLVMVAGEQSLASWLRRVHSPFATYVNECNERIGSVFVRGPKDFQIRPENEGHVIAYLHNNPVEANVVARARESDWTSHQAYLGIAPAPPWLYVNEGLSRSGFTSRDDFDRWVDSTPGDPNIVELGMVRRAARRRGAIEVATPLANPTEVPLVVRPWGHVRPNPRAVVENVATLTQMSVFELCSRRKSPSIVAARQIAIHAAAALGLSGSDIASALGIAQQSASRIGRKPIDLGQRVMRDEVVRRCTSPDAEGVEGVSVPTAHAFSGV